MKTFDPSMFITLKEGYELTSCSCSKLLIWFRIFIHEEIITMKIIRQKEHLLHLIEAGPKTGLGHNHVSGSEGDGCNPCPGRGRGRGVNLTAWMTHGKGYEDKNIGKSKCLSPLKKDAVTSNIFNLSSKRATKVNPNDGLSIHGNSHFSCS